MTGKPNRKASGNADAINKLRRSIVASLPTAVLSTMAEPLYILVGVGTIQYRAYAIWYPVVPCQGERETMAATSASKRTVEDADESPARRRILDAAFLAFMEKGYADTSTLEIARRARVSKRELYALVGNKQEMLIACIASRAERLRVPADLPEPRDRATLSRILENLGARLLREVSDPAVIAVFRLAIAEAVRAPEVARALDAIGSETSRAALREIMTRARSAGLVSGNPALMAEQFAGLLWRNLMLGLLLRVAERPTPQEITRRARDATAAFLSIYPQPDA
jgi:AcrR family transcriptional regulator